MTNLASRSVLSCFWLAWGISVLAQAPTPVSTTIEVNKVRATLRSNGALFTDGQSGQFIPVEAGLPEKTLLNGAGLWVVGKTLSGAYTGAIHTSAKTDFIPGLHSFPAESSLNGFWDVSCSDIQNHRMDFADNGIIDQPNAKIFGWPALGNSFFNSYNPGQNLPNPQYGLSPYAELGPNDATYDPLKGDVPSIEIYNCPLTAVAADQMDWFVFNAQQEELPSGLLPTGLMFQTQVMAYDSPLKSGDKTIYVRYKIINGQFSPIQDCYIGAFADFSVGNATDDFAGCDTGKYLIFAYNGDANDEGGFGTDIPAIGMDMLRGPGKFTINGFQNLPIAHMMILDNIDNLSPEAYYNILSGKFPDGTPAPNNGIMYNGNPLDPGSNSEIAAGNTPGKRYGIGSFGPFNLLPGEVTEFVVGYFYAAVPGNTPAQNAQQLRLNDSGVQHRYDGCFLDSDNACSLTSPTSEPLQKPDFRVYPNPSDDVLNIETDWATFNRVEIFNVLGQSVLVAALTQPSQKWHISIGNLNNGVYLVRVGGKTQPIVVQR